jgi:hypothetical protein
MRPHFDLFGDRYSEREEKREKVAKEELARKEEVQVDLKKI